MTRSPVVRHPRWSLFGDIVILTLLAGVALAMLWFGISGAPFVGGLGLYNDRTSAFHAEVAAGTHPYSADNLLWYPIAGAIVAALVIRLPIRWKRPIVQFVVGALLIWVPAVASLAIIVVWMATGHPFSNYLMDLARSPGDAPYLGPVVALAIIFVVASGATIVAIRWLVRDSPASRRR